MKTKRTKTQRYNLSSKSNHENSLEVANGAQAHAANADEKKTMEVDALILEGVLERACMRTICDSNCARIAELANEALPSQSTNVYNSISASFVKWEWAIPVMVFGSGLLVALGIKNRLEKSESGKFELGPIMKAQWKGSIGGSGTSKDKR